MWMPESWHRFLEESGASRTIRPAADCEPNVEVRLAVDGAFVCDLSGCALATATGPDAEAFLQGQLSNDVKALRPGRVQIAAYNTPKGRMLASLLLWRIHDGYMLQLPVSIAESLVKRLSMYVLRSKVKLQSVSPNWVRFGVGGPESVAALEAACIQAPGADYDLVNSSARVPDGARQILRLPGNRFELLYQDVEWAKRDWTSLRDRATIASDAPWRWLGVRSGIAEIEVDTQDKYVPQMLNLELVGGVSFTKGCYPGQEIVARAQYRGEIKRRMFLAHVAAGEPPVLGQDVVAAADPPQTVGTIAGAAPAPEGGYDVLACLHIDLAHNAVLNLGGPHGPRLEMQSLPYPLPQAV